MLVGWNVPLSISETSYRHSSSEVKLAISMLKQPLNAAAGDRVAFGKPTSIDVE